MKYNYKAFIAIPIILLVFSVGLLVSGYLQTGEWFLRSIDLKGGTVISVPGVGMEQIGSSLSSFEARIREVGGFSGRGILIEVSSDIPSSQILSALQAKGISTAAASIQTVGPALGESFWRQAQIAIIAAFVLMGSVVFFLFRKIVPTFTVVYTTAFDIIETLAVMQVLGVQLSLAGLAALLMMIGYSVDTDIVLDTSMFKRSGTMQEKFKSALKTGLTMSFTTMGALLVLIVTGISAVITEIAVVLLIGLILDLANTWFMNAGMLMIYLGRKGET